jgi:hypothetical protein
MKTETIAYTRTESTRMMGRCSLVLQPDGRRDCKQTRRDNIGSYLVGDQTLPHLSREDMPRVSEVDRTK